MPEPSYVIKPLAATPSDVYRQVAVILHESGPFRALRDQLHKLLEGISYDTLAEIEDLRLVAIQVAPGEDINKILQGLSKEKIVESVDQNRIARLNAAIVDDPRYREQWALEKIKAEPAWQLAKTALPDGSAPVIVGIVDTGISITHPDLVTHLWNDGAGHHGRNLLDGTFAVPDPHGHGTLLAGTIGAVSDNATGIAGASWPIQLMTMKFHDVRFPPSALAGSVAIWLAASLGAKVINVAWDVGIAWQPLRKTIKIVGSMGAVVVAGAGNDGLDDDDLATYPANFGGPPFNLSNLISVMASDEDDDKPGFSNYGLTTVHLAAPGVRILSTHSYFTTPRWRQYSGTSAACAYVSYAAALVRLLHPGLTPAQVRQRLINTVDKRPWLKCVARGRLNLANAV